MSSNVIVESFMENGAFAHDKQMLSFPYCFQNYIDNSYVLPFVVENVNSFDQNTFIETDLS